MPRNLQTIIDEVVAKGYVWSAYDQGRAAFHQGQKRENSPWRHTGHTYGTDWMDGWAAEQKKTHERE